MTARPLGTIGPRCILGESPLWDHRAHHLSWVDIDGRQVHRWDWATGRLSSRHLDGRPGSIALTADPDVLLVASEHRIGTLNWTNGDVQWRVHLPIEYPTVRLNDGRVSSQGDFWVGSMHVPASDRSFIGSIYRVRPDWSWEVLITQVGVANAITRMPSGMLWADTLYGACWTRSESDAGAPTVSGTGPALIDFATLGLPGGPDGACTDEEEGIWVACVHGSAVARLSSNGDLLARIELPVRRPTCPAFAGPNLDTLVITSIGGGGNYPIFDDEPDAGRVLTLDVGMRGLAENIFAC